jgi:hypothetical protein
MHRRIYPPNHELPFETSEKLATWQKEIEEMNITDEQLIKYNDAFFESYQKTLEEFFPPLKSLLLLSAWQPFHTTIVRISTNGVLVVYARSEVARTEVKDVAEFTAPDGTSNVYDIFATLNGVYSWFNGTASQYTVEDGRLRGVQEALSGALQFFWGTIPTANSFEDICHKLILAEGIRVHSGNTGDATLLDRHIDLFGTVVLQEPSGFRRLEEWGFEFKHSASGRVSAEYLLEIEKTIEKSGVDVLCILTPDDLTSIGRHLSVENERIRVWDRTHLERLINKHLDVARDYFASYPSAVEELSKRLSEPKSEETAKAEALVERLEACPAGQANFADFEDIGTEILVHLFGEDLGKPKSQVKTLDGKQRRDVLFPNRRVSPFFQRLYQLYEADFLIVDFKNYWDEIEPGVVDDVSKYPNIALGRFVLVVSRKAAKDTVAAAQLRLFRDDKKMVLIVSDKDLIEMLYLKSRGQSPVSLLEDKLAELLVRY